MLVDFLGPALAIIIRSRGELLGLIRDLVLLFSQPLRLLLQLRQLLIHVATAALSQQSLSALELFECLLSRLLLLLRSAALPLLLHVAGSLL